MAKVTIKDIAALLSTSPKTVSKALNNQPGVSEGLRQKNQRDGADSRLYSQYFRQGLKRTTVKYNLVCIA